MKLYLNLENLKLVAKYDESNCQIFVFKRRKHFHYVFINCN